MKPFPGKPSKPWPDQDRIKVKKTLRGIKDFGPSPNSRIVQNPSRLAEEGSSQSGGLQIQPERAAYVLRSEHTTL
ncbi:hypothetical protein SESBI_06153 [Sesbania bispinosa]|nr:hypothetical protein SESBI_06153 [Sesbania bispinosa]